MRKVADLLTRLVLAAAWWLAVASSVVAVENPSPLALLRGVEVARTSHESLKAQMEIRYLLPLPERVVECRVEQDRTKRRFEVLAGEVAGQVVIRDGDEFMGFRRKEHEDVHLYDLERAMQVRGDVAFDPRILGLSDLMLCDTTVKSCLWYEDVDKLEVAGQESIHGANAWIVRATRGETTTEYWIEEPSFRVHRRRTHTAGLHIEIESEFGSERPTWPLPVSVVAKREEPDSQRKVAVTVKGYEADVAISPERFAMASLELPVNTPIVDYRIDRVVGYWDGAALANAPLYEAERPSNPAPPVAEDRRRPLLLGITVLVILGLVVAILRKRMSRVAVG